MIPDHYIKNDITKLEKDNLNIACDFKKTKSSEENINMIDNFYCSPEIKKKVNTIKDIGELKEINIEEEVQNFDNIKLNDDIDSQNFNSEIIQIKDDKDNNLIIVKKDENIIKENTNEIKSD